ncbi:MAG: LysM peptidoglycan-binding domain-containing protein [Taibaiella sp.]|nr:LysM peptidoglycan-binding domain-containing protein [Taibaiella sp.]
MKRIYMLLILLAAFSLHIAAQESYTERAKNYVKQYADYAIADQRSTGVPAAVTLAQGILETEAGLSELIVEANNHFGVKCKNGWQGETFLHTDDAKNECFKKYKSAHESYADHSAHLLKNPRYKPLFTYSPTDYAKWSHGLKKCGYATNPKYGYQLIKIIEEYRLQEYTYAALDSTYKLSNPDNNSVSELGQQKKQLPTQPTIVAAPERIADTARAATTAVLTVADTATGFDAIARIADSARSAIARIDANNLATGAADNVPIEEGKVLTVNGLKAVYAHKDDVLLQYAVKYKIHYPHLLEINDMPDEPLAFDTYIYLEKKNTTGLKNKHAVKEGETLLMIAQEEGIQLKKLAALNLLSVDEQPQTGTALYLQEMASVKPGVKPATIKAYSGTQSEIVYNSLPGADSGTAAGTAVEEVSFGMGFEAPKEVLALENKTATPIAPKEEKTVKQKAHSDVVNPDKSDDPQQPQMKKPATEKEYKAGDKHYIVKRGETAFSIAKRHNVSVDQLLKWNNIEAQDLKAGQTILVRQ